MLPKLPDCLANFCPEVGIVLGSGLGFFAESLDVCGRLAYEQIPGFPTSTVPGHAGQFVYGKLKGRKVICMQGRFHYYEGYNMEQLSLPIQLMSSLGISTLFLTNAAGGINTLYKPGDFMLIADHINFLGTNPLIGKGDENGLLFTDMSAVYDSNLRSQIRVWAKDSDISLHEGVYLATTGPCYETPAEIRAFASIGADAVGMSTVPEAIIARQLGLRIIGLSCITNLAAGLSESPLSHDEVSQTADKVKNIFARLLAGSVELV